jgi:WD40 repeat protein
VATLSGGRVRVWSSTDGRLLSELSDAGDILDFAFTPDGRQILTGSSSNQAVLWSWQAADLAVEGCRRVTRNLTREEWDRYLGGLPYRETCPGNAEAGAEADSGRSTP